MATAADHMDVNFPKSAVTIDDCITPDDQSSTLSSNTSAGENTCGDSKASANGLQRLCLSNAVNGEPADLNSDQGTGNPAENTETSGFILKENNDILELKISALEMETKARHAQLQSDNEEVISMCPAGWKYSMRITNVRYRRIVFIAVATILILFMFLLAQFSLQASGGKGILDRAKKHFHHWEDIHCRRKHNNKTTVEKSWIPELAKQLNLKDGTSIFDSNTGCNEWLTLLRKEYPKLVIGGAHTDQRAVDYAKRLFNDTPGTFGTISSNGSLNFLADNMQFSHVINYGGLRELGDKRIQCNLVRELLRILKPGGSMYLGHNEEEKECAVHRKFSDIALPGCNWSETCLKNRTDIALIYYIKEKDLFGAHAQIDDCYTAVFIHKKVIISRANDGREQPKPKYEPHENMYFCGTGDSGGFVSNLKKLARNTNLVFPGSLSKGIKLAEKVNEWRKGNISHS